MIFLLAATVGGPLFSQSCSLDLGPDQTLTCSTTSIIIPATLTGTAPFTLMWPNLPLVTTSQPHINLNIQPSVPGSYCVTMTDNAGCSATDCVTIEIFPAPICDAGPDLNICLCESVQLNGSAAGGAGPLSFFGHLQTALAM